MKNILVVLLFCISSMLFAEAPELRRVMPNSWQKMTKLTAQEETVFLQENAELIAKMRSLYAVDAIGNPIDGPYPLNFIRIYREKAGEDVFYRLVFTDQNNPDFLSFSIRFVQGLIGKHYGKNTLLFVCDYGFLTISEKYGTTFTYQSLDIIVSNNRAKGLLSTSLEVGVNDTRTDAAGFRDFRKGQIYGKNWCKYYLMSGLPEILQFSMGWKVTVISNAKNRTPLRLDAADCLVDPQVPLRYSLQNAFDGNPATSYVENTDEDLLGILFYDSDYNLIKNTFKELALINGFAQNETLYMSNNRLKTIRGITGDILLNDNTLNWQFIKNANSIFTVTEIYKGNKYNDTCLAELNIKIDDAWIFGDVQ